MPAPAPLTSIKTRGQRKRQVAQALLSFHRKSQNPSTQTPFSSAPARIVCISDTHNKQPSLPPGDVLIHAGDLTESGSFDEMQAGLAWLSSQPHKYKIYVAGNHDVLLDEDFLDKYPERRYGQTKTKADLDWGDVIYLQDSSATLDISTKEAGGQGSVAPGGNKTRQLTVFGSPWTPQYGISAFQYRPDALDHWEEKMALIEQPPDILVTHGPPRHYLVQRDFHRAGCPYLAEMVHRLRPRLMVFGHIHAAYGREDRILDGVQRVYDEVMTGWAGWGMLARMAISVVWGRFNYYLSKCLSRREQKITTFVNAAVVAGQQNELHNPPIVVEI
ncbi:hypothetical protein PG993_000981 [Apiospora rasikravindrae]|uniref:Calcineurin-like phosphoesterase domain-containing protein n=1 Tax=Apiospora rasikravindrae TaxID=990691 RepID=A0ABR1UA33_9PEZI